MYSGILKSTTAVVAMLAMVAPAPVPAQAKANAIDLSQMTAKEIDTQIKRCLIRVERGNIVPGGNKKNAKARFCQALVNGELDDQLDPSRQSTALLAALSQSTGTSEASEAPASDDTDDGALAGAGTGSDASGQTEAQTEPQDDAATGQPATDTRAALGQDGEAVPGQTAQEPRQDETTGNEAATTNQPAETGSEPAPTQDAPVIAQDVAPVDSQAQADAVAEAEAEEPAAAAASSDAGAEAEVEVVEETVTEDTARSSNEEFDTKVSETAPAVSEARAKSNDNGLSDLEKAAILGLGALAVGQLLRKGERVVTNSGDRAVVEQNGQLRVIKNDDALLRRPGSEVKTYRFQDGSTRTVVTRQNGTQVETVRAADGRVLRRTRILQDGTEVVLFDDTQRTEQVVVEELPQVARNSQAFDAEAVAAEDLAAALAAQQSAAVNRRFSLAQIRNIDAVRRLVPEINVSSINFETGSAVIRPEEAGELAALGNALRDLISRNPQEVFLVEGHTDAVGAAPFNLALSDRRAETVALALTEYFGVPPENMVVQGYGESDLLIRTSAAERANRRAAVRRITPLLQGGE